MPSGVHVHKISNVDREKLTADCANCGKDTPVRMKAGKPRCRIANREEKRRYGKGSHGLTWEQADEFKQNASCAICGNTENLHVDHCHTFGHVRGVLCRSCNLGIGHFRDKPELLTRASEYLAIKDLDIPC